MKNVTKGRIEELIREKLAFIFEREINDRDLKFFSITEVLLSKDGNRADIYYDIYIQESNQEEIKRKLDKISGYLRKRIGNVIKIRKAPSFTFILDKRVEMEENIENILKKDKD
ncbi:30S ribosome-binding factor RbfA [candidate division WOR-3 bacterium]|nr:30S ribosome-binding factor RbfA [candidate division WOR-3 bacterium]